MENKIISTIEAIDHLIVKAKERYGDDFDLSDGEILGVFENGTMTLSINDEGYLKCEVREDLPFMFDLELGVFLEEED